MLGQLLGDPNKRRLRTYYPIVSDINILEEDIVGLSDEELRGRTDEFRQRLDKAKKLEEQLRSYLVEVYGYIPEKSNSNNYWDSGITYLINNNSQIDMSIGSGIESDQLIYLNFGFSQRFGIKKL